MTEPGSLETELRRVHGIHDTPDTGLQTILGSLVALHKEGPSHKEGPADKLSINGVRLIDEWIQIIE